MALQRGERVSVLQLLYGLLLNSGNDAAVALAEHVGKTQARFVRMMNVLARELRLRNTHYVTPHGLDAPGHFSSARDLAVITRYAMRDPVFRSIVATASFHIQATRHNHEHWLANVNKVMYWYPGVDGVKPGDTDAAGLCQVVSVNRDGRHLLAVLLHTPTLVTDIRNLLNYGLRDFRWVQAPAWWDNPANSVTGGMGSHSWSYYLGSGHYIRGSFLHYFQTHGGLPALGYPRTDAVLESGRWVQYFQGGRLAYDASRHSVYPDPLGQEEAAINHISVVSSSHVPVYRDFRGLYKQLGGRGVLGQPIGAPTWVHHVEIQLFQYGAFAAVNGTPFVVPLGDLGLKRRGLLFPVGAGDAFPPTMTPALTRLLAPASLRSR